MEGILKVLYIVIIYNIATYEAPLPSLQVVLMVPNQAQIENLEKVLRKGVFIGMLNLVGLHWWPVKGILCFLR